ncbi:MAG: hypothetical protein GXY15_05975 [Candidatus Hydrogenedentes bacterium]|nr:hypothetical protein [Candidatus Hydrogenedentota bacterium]
MTEAALYLGARDSGRAEAVDGLVAACWGRAALVVPVRAMAAARMEALLLGRGLPGVFGAPVREFNDWVRDLLAAQGREVRLVDSLERSLVMEACVDALAREGKVPGGGAPRFPAGLVRHLLAAVTKLKQAAVTPEEHAKITAGEWDAFLAEAYARYQAVLLGRGLYDIPGLYWEACLLCDGDGPVRLLGGLELVALDGFDDFTPSQLRLVLALARRVPHLVVGLNHDPDPELEDLYSLSAATVERLRETLHPAERFFPSPAPATFTGFAATALFRSEPPEAAPAGLARNLRLAPRLNVQHEIEETLREIKGLLLEGATAPSRVAVVLPDYAEHAAAVECAAAEFGVPVHSVGGVPLASGGVGLFLRKLIRALSEWAVEDVLEVVSAQWFAPEGAAAPDTAPFPRLAAAAGITGGRDEWFARLARLRERLGRPPEPDTDRVSLPFPALPVLAALERRMGALADLDDRLPLRASQAAHTRAFTALVETLGTVKAPEVPSPALRALHGALATLSQTGDPDRELDRDAFFELLDRSLCGAEYRRSSPPDAVFFAAPSALRGRSFDRVYFCGANEGVVPGAPPSNAFFSEQDIQRLRGAGVVLEGRREHAHRERLVFHHALAAAERDFVLSWRLQDARGREALPGPFVTGLGDLPGGDSLPRDTFTPDESVPTHAQAASPRDLARAALLRPLPALREAFPELLAGPLDGATVERARNDASPFGPHDGMLADPEVRAWLAEKFGPEHRFSPSALERWLACPFAFFAERVLKIAEDDTTPGEMDPRVRGILMHDALRMYYGCRRDGESAEGEGILEALEQAFQNSRGRLDTLSPGVLQAEKTRMGRQLVRFLARIRGTLSEDYAPALFEQPFGRAENGAGPLRLSVGEGETVLLSGQVDRIDLTPDGGAARIIDYKLSKVCAQSDISGGQDIQLSVYMRAVEELIRPGTVCAEAWYLSLTKDTDRRIGEKKGRSGVTREEALAAAEKEISRAVAGIRAGEFPPVTPKGKAPFGATAARFTEARIARKTGMAAAEDGGEGEA